MVIEFECPNGHKLSSSEENGGRMAKCPRCGAATLVPKVGGSGKIVLGDASPPVGNGSNKSAAKSASDSAKAIANNAAASESSLKRQIVEASPGDSGTNSANRPAAPPADDQIMFLCPNGHKLNAPKSLQGHAGQCPHCKATFRIPIIEPTEGAQSDQPEELHGGDDYSPYDDPLIQRPRDNGQSGDAYDMFSTVLSESPPASEPSFAPAAEAHPLARLVTRLWSEREHGGIVELHLAGGAMLVPEWFDAKLSQDTHGLFAVQAADGTVTMTIVPWESVQRVVVRGVVGLPDGLFE